MSACKGCGPCRQMTEAMTRMRADLAAAIKERDEARSSADVAGAALYHSESDRDAANARAAKADGDLCVARHEITALEYIRDMYHEGQDEMLAAAQEANARADVAEAGLAEAVAWLGEIRSLRDRAMARADAAERDEHSAVAQLNEVRRRLGEAEAGEGALRAALEWYAENSDQSGEMFRDGGDKARAALAGGEKKGEG